MMLQEFLQMVIEEEVLCSEKEFWDFYEDDEDEILDEAQDETGMTVTKENIKEALKGVTWD